MNSEELNLTGDRKEIPKETKNDLRNCRTPALSLFNADSDLISQLTVFAADPGITKQSAKYDGLTETDSSKESSLQSPIENHLIELDVRGKSDSSPVIDFDSKVVLIEDKTTDNGLKGLQCCSCQVLFEDRNSQVEHYKLDLHRYNLKRSLVGLPSVTAREFEETVQRRQSEGGELSSISGSEDENENEDEDDVDNEDDRRVKRRNILPNIEEAAPSQLFSTPPPPTHHPKLFFRLPDGKVASLYRALLFPKAQRAERGAGGGAAETSERGEGAVEKLKEIVDGCGDLKTAVILTGGGHFAAAVFQGNHVLEHKTFHRYVVRQKQGGTQSGKDSCGHAPKSAGASLRRYNEAALAKDIKELFGETWSSLMTSCSLIFIRAPSSNRQTFFSGKPPLLSKNDDRIRLIPFLTRRPTFNEVQRVFKVLTSFEIYDVVGDQEILFGKSGFPKSPPKRTATMTVSTTLKEKHSITERDPTTTSSRLTVYDDIPAAQATARDPVDTTESSSNEKRMRQIAKQNRRLKHLRGQEAPDIERSSSEEGSADDDDDDDVEGSLMALSFKMESLDTSVLKQFDCDLGDEAGGGGGGGGRKTRKRKTKENTPENSDHKENKTAEEKDDDALLVNRVLASYKNDLLTFCRTTDEDGFARVLDKCRKEIENGICEGQNHSSAEVNDIRGSERSLCKNEVLKERIAILTSRLLNSFIRLGASSQFTSLLHVASQTGSGGGRGRSREEQIAFVLHLLNLGCDPAKKNGEGKTVYASADKSIRLALRHFRSQFPEKFDFDAAGIPAPPSAEEAADKAERTAERKKKLRQAKKERYKEKKEERLEEEKLQQKAKEVEEDKKRFLALSEREKRALAAEKRLASQTNRCWFCASDMNGLVPFEYLDLKFCSVKCLQEHRKKNSAI